MLLAAGLLSGCAGSRGEDGPISDEFTGPWAEVFADYDSETDLEFAHRAYADSVLTDAEVQEGTALIEECYAAYGFRVEYDRYGYETVTSLGAEGDPLAVMGSCAFADGGVVALNDQIRLNPANLDPLVLAVECLVGERVVPSGYTAHDLEADLDAETPPGAGTDTFVVCMRDPLGLVER